MEKLTFESLDALLTFADKPRAWTCTCNSFDQGPSAVAFTGTETFADAVHLARYGWNAGREKLSDAMGAIASSNGGAALPVMSFDVAGAYPFIPAAAAGAPESMVALSPSEARIRPIVRLGYVLGAPGVYEAHELTNMGAAFVSICDALEAAGFRTEIEGLDYTEGSGNHCFARVMLKRAQDVFDLDRMAFALSHPAMLRRVLFAMREQLPALQKSHSGGYGRTRTPAVPLVDADLIVFAGARELAQGSAALKTPAACFAAMKDKMLARIAGVVPEVSAAV